MEASVRSKIGGKWSGDLFANRRNAYTVAAIAAVLAGILLFVFVQQYRNSVRKSATSSPVIVASAFIPRGTPATTVASSQLLERTTVKASQVQQGAIVDPSVLHGEVAATDIYPGQQLTATDFTHGSVTLASQLTGPQRAIAMPVDSTHGLIGFVQAGDRVDILASYSGANGGAHGAVSTLAQNVLVLSVPSGGGGGVGGGSGGNIVLRATDKLAVALAFAADNGKIWVTLRPPVGSQDTVSATNQP